MPPLTFMACFENIIGIDGQCTPQVPDSGFFLRDAGIDIRELNDIVGAEYPDGIALANAKINHAASQLINKVRNHFQDQVRQTSIIDGQRLGFYQDNIVFKSGGDYKGIEIELCNFDSYLDFYVSSVNFHGDFTGNITLQVWDLLQNVQVDSITIPAVANQIVTVPISKSYESRQRKLHLAFIYNSTGINTNTTFISHQPCNNCGGGYSRPNVYLYARGVKITAAAQRIAQNFTNEGDTGGLSFIYSINCNSRQWICEKANVLSLALLYLTAVELMEYSLHVTPRLNSRTTIDRERNAERMAIYRDKYENEINSVLKNMKLPDDRTCFSCRKKVANAIVLP